MAIKDKTTKLRSRTKMRKAATRSKKQAEERRIQRVFAKADKKVAEFRKQERTAPFFIGREYAVVKDKAGHGRWMKWVKDTQFMSMSTANHYMAIFRTFLNSKEAGLFSVEQQKLLTYSKVTDKMRDAMIKKAKDGKRWTNEDFKVELTKAKGSSGRSKQSREASPQKEEPKTKSKHKRWVEFVEGLLTALEDTLKDDRWKGQRKKKQIRKKYVRIGKRLEAICEHFKVPAAGNSSSDSSVYMRKKAMKGKGNAQK